MMRVDRINYCNIARLVSEVMLRVELFWVHFSPGCSILKRFILVSPWNTLKRVKRIMEKFTPLSIINKNPSLEDIVEFQFKIVIQKQSYDI